MTDVVIPSRDRTAVANAESAVNYDGVVERIIPAGTRALELPEQNVGSAALGGFAEKSLTDKRSDGDAADFSLDVDSGEAFIGGSYLARDTQTTIEDTLDNNDERTLAVGWAHDQPDSVTIQRSADFGSRDRSLDLIRLFVDGDGNLSTEDLRKTVEQLEVDQVKTSGDAAIGGELTVENDCDLNGSQLIDIGFMDFDDTITLGSYSIGGSPTIKIGTLHTLATPTAVMLGSNVRATGTRSLGIGFDVLATEEDSIGIGNATDAGGLNSVAIGKGAATDTDNEGVLGVPLSATGPSTWRVPGRLEIGDRGQVPIRDGDPDAPDDGEIWYRSDLDEYRGVENGNKVTFDTTQV